MPVTQLEHAYEAYEAAYGHLCDVAARALSAGVDRMAVQEAFYGEQGHDHGLDRGPCLRIRAARTHVNERIELVKHHALRAGVDRTAVQKMIRLARVVKAAAESEWMVTIPTTRPSP